MHASTIGGVVTFTGQEVEEAVLGHALVKGKHYLPFRKSMRVVMAHQPWDPSDPGTRFTNDLHASVALALGLEEWSELKFFTAIGSQLDWFHGVDCFFSLRGEIVTIDVTIDPRKLTAKADVVLNVSDEKFALEFGAETVARLFQKRLAKKEIRH